MRVEFIDPLFDELLGWDIENRRGRPVTYRDVIYEDRVKIGGYTKAPDYGFYNRRCTEMLSGGEETLCRYRGRSQPGSAT